MKVKIVSDKWGQLFVMNDIYPMFQFGYQKDENRWLFWIRGQYDPAVFIGREFPMEFFKCACRAKHFIMFSEGGLNDIGVAIANKVEITEGMEYIKKYIRK